jgi:uncharacterized protein (DUF1778 family)
MEKRTKGRQRDRVTGFRTTADEERLITWAAKAQGIGRSELIRTALRHYLDRVQRGG